MKINRFGLLPLLPILVMLANPQTAGAVIYAFKVADPIALTTGDRHYQSIDYRLHMDPSKVNWISWSQFGSLQSYGGSSVIDGAFANNFGVDDYFKLRVTSSLGLETNTYTLDRNDAWGKAEGHQAIIYGDKSVAPDVVRQSLKGQIREFDEGGLIDECFTEEACYNFHFDFYNKYTPMRGHNEFWLLIDAVEGYIPGPCEPEPIIPEPGTIALVGLGICGLRLLRGRRRVRST
ncbi:MAG: PEP-CTERM sorting domain-containing protein [bacterium]|nr:PEP-CTERM sorting domain-containing protein [bacterium]